MYRDSLYQIFLIPNKNRIEMTDRFLIPPSVTGLVNLGKQDVEEETIVDVVEQPVTAASFRSLSRSCPVCVQALHDHDEKETIFCMKFLSMMKDYKNFYYCLICPETSGSLWYMYKHMDEHDFDDDDLSKDSRGFLNRSGLNRRTKSGIQYNTRVRLIKATQDGDVISCNLCRLTEDFTPAGLEFLVGHMKCHFAIRNGPSQRHPRRQTMDDMVDDLIESDPSSDEEDLAPVVVQTVQDKIKEAEREVSVDIDNLEEISKVLVWQSYDEPAWTRRMPRPELKDGRWRCPFCSFSGVHERVVVGHVKTRHLNHRLFNCWKCSKAFANKFSMQKHARYEYHPLVEAFKCHRCSELFPERQDWRAHILSSQMCQRV